MLFGSEELVSGFAYSKAKTVWTREHSSGSDVKGHRLSTKASDAFIDNIYVKLTKWVKAHGRTDQIKVNLQ